MRFYLETLGCPKNVADSEAICASLAVRGHQQAPSPAEAELLVVNTCGFVQAAKEESIEAVLRLAKEKREHQQLAVVGCLSQRYRAELARELPEVDHLLGVWAWDELAALAGTAEDTPLSREGREMVRPTQATAYLKIGDGCGAGCTFCAIPSIKGPFQSRPAEELVEEAHSLASRGVREVVLVAQDTTAYGYEQGERDGLPALLERLTAEVPQIAWWRVMYAFPGRVSEKLVRLMSSNPRICRYLDLPLQHADPRLLAKMGRPSIATARRTIARLRAAMPDIVLRTTFIVGFPGETEHEFQALLSFIEEVEFDRVGIFTYSREEGTAAAGLRPQVPMRVREERRRRALELQRDVSLRKNRALVGKEMAVLVEGEVLPSGRKDGAGCPWPYKAVGRSYRDAPEVDGLVFLDGAVKAGEMARARVIGASAYDLFATLSS